MHRIYENSDIVVFWNSEKCFHSRRCVTASPLTFDPMRKPWIDVTKDKNSNMWQAIESCPSGALSCTYRHDIDVKMDEANLRSVAYAEDKEIGECDYSSDGSGISIYHTGVDSAYEGKGIAKRLVYTILEYAERNRLEVSATCSYAKKLIEDNKSNRLHGGQA